MAQKVEEIVSDEIIDEKKILKDAKEKEKEIKKEIKEAKVEAKKSVSRAASRDKKEKVSEVRKASKHGKKYRAAIKIIDKSKAYPIDEAIKLAKKSSTVNFDATIDLHVKIDSKMENIRGSINLPGGIAKQKKILKVTEKNIEQVKSDVKAGKTDFDIMLADAKVMPKLAPLAKILGPRGLMPNPKSGTVVDDVDKAEKEFLGGKVEYKADQGNVVHLAVGKVSHENKKINENIESLLAAMPASKLDSAYLATSMGPSIRISIS